ncbi:hypothetical protein SAMN05192529_12323 [Arachidicoccus rhizosphaerae]|uniref:Spermatogenesis-associated protein 20-like TRX domain-containing protein n=1 Tax=Arachidicoccus rhizosphaerae TaxID=551991 RepID=A0A1H4BNY3_9BACT|nr:thioredoxin domain-containing protein [Arachidicoccus rhizosphaerae]SEA49875.1 hypothetical protein SAMN05192529_12323 [Arachidicoccus rhizosphaerae]
MSEASNKKPNHLISETSPYLLQHAYNPVEWYPWGEAALQLARQENKPILVSIGYAACHWCHVMENESFEDHKTADFMNAHFINIKVDREERPDLDHLYMDAVQAMSGQGGWPLNVFLLPDTRPFFGGTYFPPKRIYQRPSWTEVLDSVEKAFREQFQDLVTQADNLMEHLKQQNLPLSVSTHQNTSEAASDTQTNESGSALQELTQSDAIPRQADQLRQAIMQTADTKWGGFGRAPKFPQSFTIRYLLRDYYYTGNTQGVQQALLSLDKMLQGGIYDQIGGGFARYSTDDQWLVPHFEKMLYDNALLLEALCEAYQLTGNAVYERTIRQTVDFLSREMHLSGGGFYAALDADSEGVEGKYYVWQKSEIERILGPEAELFCLVYDVEQKGNWEEHNILWLQQSITEVAKSIRIKESSLISVLDRAKEKLLSARSQRVAPGKDDKIILGWNALLITALCKCGQAISEPLYTELAENCYHFLKAHLTEDLMTVEAATTATKATSVGGWRHHWNKKPGNSTAFLDDYAALIQALLELNSVTGNKEYLQSAASLTGLVTSQFSDENGHFFYYTNQATGALVRKMETYDNATPSGNAIMADNLWRLAVLLDKAEWRDRALYMVASMEPLFTHYPTSFGCWATLWQKIAFGTPEIAIIGQAAENQAKEILKQYIPGAILQYSAEMQPDNPLLSGKKVLPGQTFIYLCQNYECNQPVMSVQALINSLSASGVHLTFADSKDGRSAQGINNKDK